MSELELIKNILANYTNGASIEEIESKLNLKISRRTLQRRLVALEEQNIIKVSGKTRGVKYYLSKAILKSNEEISLSEEAKNILTCVSSPISKRKPVSYNRDFLDSYIPNESFYLKKEDVVKLQECSTIYQERKFGTYDKKMLHRLLIDLSWNSSRLEGNTYSLLDTQKLIFDGESADGKSVLESQMILNHKEAIEFLSSSVDDIEFNRFTILNLHGFLANNLLPDPNAPGRLRNFAVGISSSVYEPLAVGDLIQELFELILAKAQKIKNPFEQAFFIMVHLPYLQPFDDVNKRVSRLALNIPFFKNNLCPLSFIDVPEDLYISGIIGVYELNKVDLLKEVFIWAYERSAQRYGAIRQTVGEPKQLKVKYRNLIQETIEKIFKDNITNPQNFIQQSVESAEKQDQQNLINLIETEILSLHEGNIARYKITLEEFKSFKN